MLPGGSLCINVQLRVLANLQGSLFELEVLVGQLYLNQVLVQGARLG